MSAPVAALEPDAADLAHVERGLRANGVEEGRAHYLARVVWELVVPVLVARVGADVVAAAEAHVAMKAEAFDQLRLLLRESRTRAYFDEEKDAVWANVSQDFIGSWEHEHGEDGV